MRKFYAGIIIASITLVIGISAFYLFTAFNDSSIKKVSVEKPEEKKVEVKNQEEAFDIWKLPEGFAPLKQGEFFNVGHACGNGYVDGYLAYDGSKMSAGLDIVTPKEFKKTVGEAQRIIDSFENFQNKDVKKGVRIILKGQNKTNGKEFYEIILYDKKKNMYYIVGPNLEIALELEKWLESQK